LRTGSAVVACPPDNEMIRQAVARGYIAAGSCLDAREPLLKTATALAGDVVAVSAIGVTVNGRLLAGTIPLVKDSAGRKLTWFAATNYRLRPDEVWLTANSDPRSFDSRYFGPVPASHVIGLAQPIWTFR
jgi:conjugative transfer signal peptidase TraF